jgi:hypothetical protein
VMQWTRLKQSVRIVSSEERFDSMCEYRRAATAPPALCPVMTRLQPERKGFSSSKARRRAATGLSIFRATLRKPEWQKLPASSRKSRGEAGVELRLTAQSMNVWEPRIAKMMVEEASMGTDLMTIALVPIRQSAEMWVLDSEVADGLL